MPNLATDMTAINEARGIGVNEEREKRLYAGGIVTINYADGSKKYVPMRGDQESMVKFGSVVETARYRQENEPTNLNADIIYRDREDNYHLLSYEEALGCAYLISGFVRTIMQDSWKLKDANPVPENYADDIHWWPYPGAETTTTDTTTTTTDTTTTDTTTTDTTTTA